MAVRRFTREQAASRTAEAKADYGRELSESGREIAKDCPKPKRAAVREACRKDLRKFLEAFLSKRFPRPWGEPQLQLIASLQAKLHKGGRHAFALPRGSGKTSIVVASAIWASFYAHRRYLVLIGATAEAAAALLHDYRMEVESNDLLYDAFPEICYPIRRLEGLSTRRAGQTFKKVRTLIHWSDRKVVLPTVPKSVASGAVVQSYGLTGSIRGLVHKQGGKSIRPDMIVVDDFQTSASAGQPSAVAKRLAILNGDVLGLAGPGDAVSAFVAGTVIADGDGMDQLLDRKKYPIWQGVRVAMITSEPTDVEGWKRYAEIRSADLEAGGTGSAATRYYRENRTALDEGGAVSWDARKLPDEVSALQSALNLRMDIGSSAFAAEYQNRPVAFASTLGGAASLNLDVLTSKVAATLPRGAVPRDAVKLTAGIDFQDELFPWVVVAWSRDGSGHVVDYGTHPEQGIELWSTSGVPRPLSLHYPGKSQSARWWTGLSDLVTALAAREWVREELNDPGRVERIGIDAGWGKTTDLVYQLCRRSAHAAILTPTHGRGIGPAKQPMALWTRRPGDLAGTGYRIQSAAGANRGRHVTYDSNLWKSRLSAAVRSPMGNPGGMTFPTGPHKLLFSHLTSEYPSPTSGVYGSCDVWSLRPEAQGQNHYLDCLVIASVLAAALGIESTADGQAAAPVHLGPPPVPVSHAALARQAQRSAATTAAGTVSHRALALAAKSARETDHESLL